MMVLHMSAYSVRCLLSLFPAIFHRFVFRARVGDDILDLCGLLIADRLLNSSWNSIFLDPTRVASTLGDHQLIPVHEGIPYFTMIYYGKYYNLQWFTTLKTT